MDTIIPVNRGKAEEYPEGLKAKMDIVEERFQNVVQNKLEPINNKLLKYLNTKLYMTKSLAEVDSLFTLEDFTINLESLSAAMIIGTVYDRRNTETQLKDAGVDLNNIDLAFAVDFSLKPDAVKYRSRLKEHESLLAETLKQTTIEKADRVIEDGIRNGKTYKEIAKELSVSLGFDEKRAELIARTEANWALNEGIRLHQEEIGVKEFKISPAPNACDNCKDKAKKTYKVTDKGILPVHPRCRCVQVSVIPKEWLS